MSKRPIRSLVAPAALPALVVALALGPGSAALQAQEQGPGEASLYQRLGGYDAIAAVVDDFFARFGGDPELTPFLGGINAVQGARIRQRFVDFACATTGGPCLYLGRDMRGAHEGLPITVRHFEQVMGHFRDALRANGVSEAAASEFLTMLETLRAEVLP